MADYDIADRISRILVNKANEGIVGMGVYAGAKRRKRATSKTAKKRKGSKKHCTISKSCKRVFRGKGCCGEMSEYEDEGAGVYAGARKKGSKTSKKKHCTVSKSCKRVRRGAGVYAGRVGSKKGVKKGKKRVTKKRVAKKRVVKRKGSKSSKRKGAIPKQLKPWITFLNKFRKAHPNMNEKQIKSNASKAYHKR